MEKRYNPLREWRGIHDPYSAGLLLGLCREEYLTLELHPARWINIKSDTIIRISKVTHIPLEVLVDYLTQKESVQC